MNKRKMILPLLAIVFAVAAAFAFLPPQSAFYNTGPGTAATGTISTPASTSDIVCGDAGSSICKVGLKNAYSVLVDAQNQTSSNLMRYTPAP